MKKLGWFIFGTAALTFIVKCFYIAMICTGIIICLMGIHKIIIRQTPRPDSNLKWGGNL